MAMLSNIQKTKIYNLLIIIAVICLNGCTSISLNNENDAFSFGKNRDMLYSQGFRFSAEKSELETPKELKDTLAKLPNISTLTPTHYTATIGQEIYTPDNLQETKLIESENPYAGWLYGRFSKLEISENYKKTSAISLGIIGKYSFAEEVQSNFHKLIGARQPMGWQNQLHTEPGLILEHAFEKKDYELKSANYWKFLQTSALMSRLGNINTDLSYIMTQKFGKNFETFLRPEYKNYSFYIFNIVRTTAVGRNIFLDGNTFEDSHSVDKNNLVADWRFGIAIEYNDWAFSIYQALQSKTFKEQDKDYHQFGGFNIQHLFK